MVSHQQPSSVRVIVEGSIYKVNVKKPAHQSLRDICRAALIQHLAVIFEIEEVEAELVEDRGSIKIIKVQEESGLILHLNDTFIESGLAEGSLLRIRIKISNDELSERVRSLSLCQVEESAHFPSGILKSSLSKGNEERSISDSNLTLEVSINGHSSKIGTGSGELLRDVCQSAIVSHMKKIHQLTQEDAVARIESQRMKVFSVKVGGTVLDLDKEVFKNGLSGGEKLNVTFTALTSDPLLSDDEITKSPLQFSNSQSFQSDVIRMATNNYSQQNFVGEGGQATVYKGWLFGSMVAVKKYHTLDLTHMKREIEALQKVRHPNVILLMGHCEEENVIITEFMEGGSLSEKLCGKPEKMSWIDRYRVVDEIVSALYFLHQHSFLHRDMKPANILFDSRGTAKVTDMGFAKLSSASMDTSELVGTYGYMDPNFIISKKCSTRMDVYALGLIILQLCTHKKAVQEIHDIFNLIPQGQKRNSKFSVKLFKGGMVACDSSMPSEEMALTLLEVGLKCVEQDSKDRPTLLDVMKKLRRIKTEFEMDYVPWYTKAAEQVNNSFQNSLGYGDQHGQGVEKDFVLAVQPYMSAAEQGNSSAQYILGYCFKHGQGVKKDLAKAVQWYSKAAEQGNASAQDNLGHCYQHGQGVEKDLSKAMQWYIKSAEQGNISAQNNVGNGYQHGLGVDKDFTKAVEWCKKAAEQGNSAAQYNLGWLYDQGYGVEKDWCTAMQWYTKAAEQGNSSAQFSLGWFYDYGQGVEKDWVKAAQWYTKAAEQGHSYAQYIVGSFYDHGKGVEKDLVKAVQWYVKAAVQGDASAQDNLGYCYQHGKGVEKDLVKAMQWYIKSAEQGNMLAQNNVGNCYQYGQGVEKDLSKAFQWYKKAAEQGNSAAQYNLGWLYDQGHGVEKDWTKAMQWYTKAAEQGNSSAQFSLGWFYEYGQGVEIDWAKACQWYTKSAEQGCSAAQNRLIG